MKPVNSYLGVSPTRTSRVSSLDVGTRSLDSVLFQQGKSMLDYDLNVMQSVLKTNIETIARQIFSTSGIIQSNYTLSFNATTGTVTINPFDAQVYGAPIHVASSIGAITSSRPAGSTYSQTTFLWLEVWYQEIATSGSNETISSISTDELKDTLMYQYGGVDVSNEYLTAPSLIDPVFGAETTRRIQLRWRIRHVILTTQINGFSSSASTLSEVKARGGRTSAFDIDATNIFQFIRSDNYSASSSTTYEASLKNSLIDFVAKNDAGLYVAGRGTANDALLLNTVDGRVYGLPLATIVGTSTTSYTITPKFIAVGLSSASTISVTGTTSATGAGDVAYQHTAGSPTLTVSTSSAPNKIQFTLSDSTDNYVDLYLTPKTGTSRPGYVVPTRISVSEPGTEAIPSITFLKSTVSGKLGDTGFYYLATTTPSLNVTAGGSEIARFSNGGTTVTRMLTAKNLTVDGLSVFTGASTFNGNITLGTNIYITGSANGVSNFPKFSSASATITGGTISSTTLILANAASAAPTTLGDTQWDTTNKTIKIGGGSSTTYSYGYLGSTLPPAIAATNTAASGTSWEAARVDHVHAAPASGLTPAAHKGAHLAGGADAFVDGDVLDANARVGIKISASGTGTDRASGTVGEIVKKRVVQFIAGTGIYLDLSTNTTTSLDQLDLKITANNAGVLDTVTTAPNSGTSAPTDVTLGGSSLTGTSPYVSRRDHKHGLSVTYATTIAAISSTTFVAGSDTSIPRGDHKHAMPTYLANAIGFGAEVTTGATQVDIFGANNYSTHTSTLAVRDTSTTLGDNGGRIAFGGYTATGTYGVFGAISARKSNVTSANSRGYLSLFTNSSTGLAEFFRGYDTGGVYIGTSYFADPGANNLTVGGKIQVFTSGAAANAPTTGTTASTGELMRFMAGVSVSSPSGLAALVGLNSAGLWIQSTNSTNFATKNSIMLNPTGGSVGIGTNAPSVVPLQITSTTAAADPATTGTTPSTGEIVRLRTGSDTVGGIGTIGLTANKMWIQATDATALGTTNQLLLNPNGGAVGIGTLTPNATFDVTGSGSGNGLQINWSGASGIPFYAYRSSAQIGNIADFGHPSGYLRLSADPSNAFYALAIAGPTTPFSMFALGGSTGIGLALFAGNVERVRITASGNIGVGTTTPATKLEIAHDGASTYGTAIQLKTISGTDGPRLAFEMYNADTPKRWNVGIRNSGTAFGIFEDGYHGAFGTERVTVLAGGNVGIGTSIPSATLHVVGTVAGAVAPKVFLPAQAFNLPTSSFPAFYQRDTGTTKYELQYSGSADQFAHTTIVVPSSYSGGSITIKFYWYTALANQSVTWQILAASTGDGGDPNPSTSSLVNIVSTTNSAAKLKLQTYSWISSNTVSLPSAGQILYLSLKRVGSSNDQTFNFHSMIVEF